MISKSNNWNQCSKIQEYSISLLKQNSPLNELRIVVFNCSQEIQHLTLKEALFTVLSVSSNLSCWFNFFLFLTFGDKAKPSLPHIHSPTYPPTHLDTLCLISTYWNLQWQCESSPHAPPQCDRTPPVLIVPSSPRTWLPGHQIRVSESENNLKCQSFAI